MGNDMKYVAVISSLFLLVLFVTGCTSQPQSASSSSSLSSTANLSTFIKDSPYRGNISSGRVIFVFSDFQCPYCRKGFVTEPKGGKDYAVVFKNYPLPFHQFAKYMAMAAECAAQQGVFWQAHDKLFTLPEEQLSTTAIDTAMESTVKNYTAYKLCMEGQLPSSRIAEDEALARAWNVQGTPTYIIVLPSNKTALAQKLANILQAKTSSNGNHAFVVVVGYRPTSMWENAEALLDTP